MWLLEPYRIPFFCETSYVALFTRMFIKSIFVQRVGFGNSRGVALKYYFPMTVVVNVYPTIHYTLRTYVVGDHL